jgi:hypothetical protein
MKYYKAIVNLPGHKINDILIETNGFYMWEKAPHYSFPAEVVENNKEHFERIVINYNEGEDIWYLSLNGIIIADKFSISKHSSLDDFGNLFKSEELAKSVQNEIKKILKKYN